MSNSLDPNQAQQNVGPDLGPISFKGYQQTTKVATSKERVKEGFLAYAISSIIPLLFYRVLDTHLLKQEEKGLPTQQLCYWRAVIC